MALFRKKQIPPEEIKLDEIDRESKYKIFSPAGDRIIKVILTCWALFQLYASISNKVPLQILRYTHLGLAISMAYTLSCHEARRQAEAPLVRLRVCGALPLRRGILHRQLQTAAVPRRHV